MGAQAQMAEKKETSAEVLARIGLKPENLIAGGKGNYGVKVSDQVKMTGLSDHDYYAKHNFEMKDANLSEKDKMLFLLLGMHKAGERAEEALREAVEKGVDWKTSSALREDDKKYLEYAGRYLDALGRMGISSDKPAEEVIKNIKDNFGKIGEEIAKNAEMMPIFGEVIEIKGPEDMTKLQKGDRILDYVFEDGSMRALRGGDMGATALLYLTTFLTCQGVSAERFKEIANSKGDDAFSTSSDEHVLVQRGYTAERIKQLREEGMIARGGTMFTEHRFKEMSGYYTVGEVEEKKEEAEVKVTCGMWVNANPGRFVEGEALENLVIKGGLSIKIQGVDKVDSGGGQTVSLAISRKEKVKSPTGEDTYMKIYEAPALTTDSYGNFSVEIKKEDIKDRKKWKAGEYVVDVRYKGSQFGEEIDCSNQTTIIIDEKGKAKVDKERPIEIMASVVLPRKTDWKLTGPYKNNPHLYQWAETPPETKIYNLELGQIHGFGVRGTMMFTTTKTKVTTSSGKTEFPELGEKGKKETSIGAQLVYNLPLFKDRFKVRTGWLFAKEAKVPMVGVQAQFPLFGSTEKWGRASLDIGNDLGAAVENMVRNMSHPVSHGFGYMYDVKSMRFKFDILDPFSEKYRRIALGIGVRFGGKKEKEEKPE